MDLPHVCNLSSWIPFHSLRFRNFFCLQLTLSASPFGIFLIPGTFHPRRSSLAWPCWPTSNLSPLNSNPLYLAPTRERRHPPPPTRTVLPALTHFEFQGVSEYLEDLVARIDAPLLDSICITFLHQLIFDISQLAQFMRRTTRFQALNEAHVDFDYYGVLVESLPPTRTFDEKSGLRISCREIDWDLSSLAQVFTSFFPSIYIVEHLYIYGSRYLYHNGKTTSRTCNGWKFSAHLLL